MTSDFKRGFILGLAQKPLYVGVGVVNKTNTHKFVFTVSGGEEFTLPALSNEAVTGIISWGDGISDTYRANASITHTYDDDLTNAERLITISCDITALNASVFRANQILIRSQLGNGVTSIGGYAFCLCSNLCELRLPETLLTAGDFLIAGNNNNDEAKITALTISPSINTWGNYTFANRHLTTLHLTSGLEIIGANAFRECTSLSTVYVPKTITAIGSSTFGCNSACAHQLTIYYDGTVAQWNAITIASDAFTNRTGYVTVVCTDGSITI